MNREQAPIKLTLQVPAAHGNILLVPEIYLVMATQIASDHLGALEKLIEAYVKISETLPRFGKLNNVFQGGLYFSCQVGPLLR